MVNSKVEHNLNVKTLCRNTDDPDDVEILEPNYFLFYRANLATPFLPDETLFRWITLFETSIQRVAGTIWTR